MQTSGKLSLTINYISVIIGTIGGLCNLLIFTAAKFRRSPTVFYLLCANIFQMLSVLFGLPTRMALDNYGNTLEYRSLLFCKLRYYFGLTWPQLATYFMLFATIDRFFVTSHHARIRAWSQLRAARRLSMAAVVVIHATAIHISVFYNTQSGICQISPGTVYTVFFAVYLILIISLLPHLLMLIASLLTFRNLQLSRQRILPALEKTRPQRQIHRFEIQLIKVRVKFLSSISSNALRHSTQITVVQVILSSTLVLLRLGSYAYSTVTSGNLNKTAYARAVEIFTLRMGIALYYFSFAASFYVSTLASKSFRQVFRSRMTDLYARAQRLHTNTWSRSR